MEARMVKIISYTTLLLILAGCKGRLTPTDMVAGAMEDSQVYARQQGKHCQLIIQLHQLTGSCGISEYIPVQIKIYTASGELAMPVEITYNNRGTMTYSAHVQPQPPGEIIVQLEGDCGIANNLGLIRIGQIVTLLRRGEARCQARE